VDLSTHDREQFFLGTLAVALLVGLWAWRSGSQTRLAEDVRRGVRPIEYAVIAVLLAVTLALGRC
jgi:hypothetical protein